MVLATALLIGATALLGDSVARFTERFPMYQGALQALVEMSVLGGVGRLPPPRTLRACSIRIFSSTSSRQTVKAVVTVLSRLL